MLARWLLLSANFDTHSAVAVRQARFDGSRHPLLVEALPGTVVVPDDATMADNTWTVLITASATLTGVRTGSLLTALTQRRQWEREESSRKRQARRDRHAELLAVAEELSRLFTSESATQDQVRELGRLAAYSRLHDHREVHTTATQVHTRAIEVQSAIATHDGVPTDLVEDYESGVTAFRESVRRYARE
ncbi:hypothetical protein GCM10009837_12490 [Streptomyces durmitorensis]